MKRSAKLDFEGLINPDGVEVVIPWADFLVGASVFIPALDMTRLMRQMHREARLLGGKLVCRERIEGGKIGVRFWRIL